MYIFFNIYPKGTKRQEKLIFFFLSVDLIVSFQWSSLYQIFVLHRDAHFQWKI
jgi:hypothetical protein